jgi:hypothetical protein
VPVLLGLLLAGWLLARLGAAPKRVPRRGEPSTRMLGPGEEPPEFVAGQPVCWLETWEWGVVRVCRRSDGVWRYEVDFTGHAAELSGDELVP